jgi:hypothetical protein
VGLQKSETSLGQYNLACFWALAGYRRESLTLLRRCVAHGLVPTWMSSDQDLASLRDDPEFKLIEKAVRQRSQEALSR